MQLLEFLASYAFWPIIFDLFENMGRMMAKRNTDKTQKDSSHKRHTNNVGSLRKKLVERTEEFLEASTRIREVETDLETISEQYAYLIEHLNCIVIKTNIKGKALFCNSAVEWMLGHRPDDIVGKSMSTVFFGNNQRDVSVQIRRLGSASSSEPISTNFECEIVTAKKLTVWISWSVSIIRDKSGKAQSLLWVGADVTHLKQTEQELRRLSVLVSNSNDAVTIRGLDGRILFWNKGAEKMYGYTQAEALAMNITDIVPPRHKRIIMEVFDRIKKGEVVRSIETKRVTKDGRILDVWLTITRLDDVNRAFTAIGTTERDVTEYKHMAREIVKASENELDRIGRELHDTIGQQMTALAIKSKSLERSLLTLTLSLPDQAKEALELSQIASDAIAKTRTVSRMLHPVDESTTLIDALRYLARSSEELLGIRCRFQCTNIDLTQYATFANNLYRIAQEAITNAVRHAKSKNIVVRLSASDGQLLLTIENDGKPFPSKLPKKRGLGLRSMSYRTVIMSGKLDILKRPAGGTVVKCSVPMPDESQQ